MKAVKCKNGNLTFISRDESAIYRKIGFSGELPVNTLTERESHLADEMFKRDILGKKLSQGHAYFYTYEPQNKPI